MSGNRACSIGLFSGTLMTRLLILILFLVKADSHCHLLFLIATFLWYILGFKLFICLSLWHEYSLLDIFIFYLIHCAESWVGRKFRIHLFFLSCM